MTFYGGPFVPVKCGGVSAQALVHSVAARSIISKDVLAKLITTSSGRRRAGLCYAQQTIESCANGTMPHKIRLPIRIGDKYAWKFTFYVASSHLCVDMILGIDFFDYTGLILDVPCRMIYFHFEYRKKYRQGNKSFCKQERQEIDR